MRRGAEETMQTLSVALQTRPLDDGQEDERRKVCENIYVYILKVVCIYTLIHTKERESMRGSVRTKPLSLKNIM